MERSIYNKLVEWKNKRNHKPLILNGARQVGKTYILQEFGKREYKKLAFFSLDRNQKAAEVFEKGGTTARMFTQPMLEIYADHFPAAILQPPFFDPTADDAIQAALRLVSTIMATV